MGTFNDSALLQSSNPTHAIIDWDISGTEYAFSMIQSSSSTGFVLNLLRDPRDNENYITGTRKVEYLLNPDNSYTFYTRGVIKKTEWYMEDLTAMYYARESSFNQRHNYNMWRSFQLSLYEFVLANGGTATLETPYREIPDWGLAADVVTNIFSHVSLNLFCNP